MKYSWSFLLLFFYISVTAQSDETPYLVSRLYDNGAYEITVFNNYYSKKAKNSASEDFSSRINFYTINAQLLYGLSKKWNIGLDLKIRSVTASYGLVDPTFKALNFQNDGNYFRNNTSGYTRSGITAIGLRSKIVPIEQIPNLSVQQTFYIPLNNDQEGGNGTGFIDWSGYSFNTQIFYDHELMPKVFLFTELDLFIENIGQAMFQRASGYYQYSTPMTMIVSYYPNAIHTFFALVNAAPQWGNMYDEQLDLRTPLYDTYNQYGLGYKYAIGRRWLFEVILTRFLDKTPTSRIYTYNFGVRYFSE